MIRKPLSVGIKDVCASLFFKLNCDGTLEEELDPILFCGLSSYKLRKTIEEGEEQEQPNPPSSAGKVCLSNPAETKRGPCFLDILSCGLEVPELWSWLNLEAPTFAETGEVDGWEEITSATELCGSCGKSSAGCRHKVAFMSIHNAWCGDFRHPTIDYVANIYPSIETVLQEEEVEFGQGFTSFREFSTQLKRNENFADPWGIMVNADGEPQGTFSKYKTKFLNCPDGSTIGQIIDLACSCADCTGQETTLELARAAV